MRYFSAATGKRVEWQKFIYMYLCFTWEETNLSTELQQQIKQLNKRRWFVWLPLALAFMTAYFHRTATGVMADSLMRDFSITSASELGVLSSIYFYIYAATQMPAGILTDRFGPRKTVSVAMLIAAAGAVVFGAAGTMSGIYLGRVMVTLGVSVIYVCIIKIYVEWFRLREFGTMCGVIVVVANAGSLVSGVPLAFAVEMLGWRSSYFIIAGYSLAMAVLCWLVVRDRPPDTGLPAIEEVESFENSRAASPPVQATCLSVRASVAQVLGNMDTWWPFLAASAVYGVYMSFMGIWGVPYFMQIHGLNRVEASSYVMTMAVGNMIGGQLIGFASDRVGLRRSPYTMITIFFLSIWLLLTCWGGAKPPLWALYPISLGIGIGTSGITLGVACSKEVNSPQTAGVAAGIANSGPFVGAAFMQPAFGWVLDHYWQGAIENGVRIYPLEAFQSAFWFCVGVLVIGLLCTLRIRETRCCNIWADGKVNL